MAADVQDPVGGRTCRAALATALALALLAGRLARAAPEEIQVYLDDLSPPGGFGLDVHNNFVPSGATAPEYPGAEPPSHMYRLTPEFYYGLARDVELGLYVLSTRTPADGAQLDGAKLRIKYVAPNDPARGLFWGANLEFGDTAQRVSQTPVNGELKGILGWRGGPWLLAVNPNVDWSLSARGGPATLDVDFKVARAVSVATQLGLESYNELGPVGALGPLGRNSKTLYAVLDTERDGIDFNAGIGRGLTADSDRWVLKLIVGLHFGRR